MKSFFGNFFSKKFLSGYFILRQSLYTWRKVVATWRKHQPWGFRRTTVQIYTIVWVYGTSQKPRGSSVLMGCNKTLSTKYMSYCLLFQDYGSYSLLFYFSGAKDFEQQKSLQTRTRLAKFWHSNFFFRFSGETITLDSCRVYQSQY